MKRCLVPFLVLVFALFLVAGCDLIGPTETTSTTHATTTTTTTSSSTTTTLGYSISGTISGVGQGGLVILIVDNPNLDIIGLMGFTQEAITPADGSSKSYNLIAPAAGTYYVLGIYSSQEVANYPPTGTKAGAYQNGFVTANVSTMDHHYFTANWSNRTGSPVPVTLEASSPSATGIDFALNSVYTGSSISGRVNGLSPGWLYVTAYSATGNVEMDCLAFTAEVTSQTSMEFTVGELPAGDYYLVAFLVQNLVDFINTKMPVTGDKAGAVNDGYFPAAFDWSLGTAWTALGTPDVITLGASHESGFVIPGLFSTHN